MECKTMTKIFMRTVFADGGVTKTFGTEKDIPDWKKQEEAWIAEELNCSEDTIQEIGDSDNIEKLLDRINKELRQ